MPFSPLSLFLRNSALLFKQSSFHFFFSLSFFWVSEFLCPPPSLRSTTRKMMGFSQSIFTDSINPLNDSPNASSSSIVPKTKTILQNMIWEIGGFACVIPTRRRRSGSGKDHNDGGEVDDDDNNNTHNNGISENNKAWLLAESGGCVAAESTDADPHSVHSSFRFSFCSQVELESLNNSSSAASKTVLMVNLDNGSIDSRSKELKWRRIESLERSISPVAKTLIRFSYGEILSATRNFSKGRVLGRGALSCVFRGRVGILRTAVAIKRLDKEDNESEKAFCRELMIASSLQNPNIVPLVGFCIHPEEEEGLFLVYKYVSGGSLERHLHEKKRGVKGYSSSLPWSVRYKVAVGIAEAIGYLHNGTERCVVHRDIKPSNILLSSKKIPKLCDFGLATWTPAPSIPFLCKTVKGTFGYLAPEYFQHGKVSDKTDVYAFGVVLLELITGRKPIEAKRPPGEENLVLWAKSFLQSGKEATEGLLDPYPKLTPRNSTRISRMIQAAAACINSEESRRPSIDEIIAILRDEDQLVCSNKKKKSGFPGNGCIIDYYSQLHHTKSDMKSHLALAMLGVSELEDDDHLHCR